MVQPCGHPHGPEAAVARGVAQVAVEVVDGADHDAAAPVAPRAVLEGRAVVVLGRRQEALQPLDGGLGHAVQLGHLHDPPPLQLLGRHLRQPDVLERQRVGEPLAG